MRISCRPSERYTDVAKQHEKTSGLVFLSVMLFLQVMGQVSNKELNKTIWQAICNKYMHSFIVIY